MHRRKSLALLGATGGVAVALAALGSTAAGKPAASARAAGTPANATGAGKPAARTAAAGIPVTVRIEGDTKTLLPTTKVTVHPGLVKKGGHSCSDTTAAGALNVSTRDRWSGKWYSGLGFEVFRIFSETDVYAKTHSWWELFVNNQPASAGMCSIKLHRGDQLLFAAVAAKGTEYPLALKVLTKPVAGKPFKVQVLEYYRGKARPSAGAKVSAFATSAEPIPNSTVTAMSNSHGIATLTVTRTGLIDLQATKAHFIRSADVPKDVGQ